MLAATVHRSGDLGLTAAFILIGLSVLFLLLLPFVLTTRIRQRQRRATPPPPPSAPRAPVAGAAPPRPTKHRTGPDR